MKLSLRRNIVVNRDFMLKKVDQARKALAAFDVLAGLDLNPPILWVQNHNLDMPEYVLWQETCQHPWERMDQILEHFDPLPQFTAVHWMRSWTYGNHRPSRVPNWQPAGSVVVIAEPEGVVLMAWVQVFDIPMKIMLKSPHAAAGVEVSVTEPLGALVFDLPGWEKIVEVLGELTYFYLSPELAISDESHYQAGYAYACGYHD